jgi:hypothetical protein
MDGGLGAIYHEECFNGAPGAPAVNVALSAGEYLVTIYAAEVYFTQVTVW